MRVTNRLLIVLLTICIVRLWFMLLTGSFWTDETGTAFVVKLPGDASLSVAPQVPASIYYALPRAVEKLFGFSEILYRIPSLLLMGIAFFIIGRLAARLIGPRCRLVRRFPLLRDDRFQLLRRGRQALRTRHLRDGREHLFSKSNGSTRLAGSRL